ncbi:hypothetical protein DC522_29510 [Microvirga sp. KLBC 81]|uniref:Type III secretion protein n=1 Tax=Microvirga vignae TaxID=1225564 RepID=A0A0H1R7P2_9HYPH|nr:MULTISPECIES: YscO family type III secretion system apparatus protein [Microvirga]KLK91188.1 hypothetical protein AA309_21555 [Microvirga vignae]PVE20933.1 hypothetical protein DC522_29510 [Microvirga sp. KLBC 81]
MVVASDRVSSAHASSLCLVKHMRERSALNGLSTMEAKRHAAALATERASRDLAVAEQQRARLEAELYQHLMSLDLLSVAELDRCHLFIERLTAEITLRRRILDDARVAQGLAETAVSEMRAHWAECSAATHKWEQIEADVRRAADSYSEIAAEMEADDEILLRYGRGLRGEVAGDSI